MKSVRGYKIAIAFLLGVIFLQWMVMATRERRMPAPPAKAPAKAAPPVHFKGNIALVIDDWAYNLNNVGILDRINAPLTCSVLPNLSYSREVAEELHARGLEVILHLPMEPQEKMRLEKNTILISMNKDEIRQILDEDLSDFSYIKGVSNHQGSRATQEVRTMEIVFGELKERRLYFLDSLVTAKSVCKVAARKVGLRFAKRDVFLDNLEEPSYIKKQIERLKALARQNGSAIGIGHDRRTTLEVLAEVIPELRREGYRFVFVSELAK
jgi:uncharacterized protein